MIMRLLHRLASSRLTPFKAGIGVLLYRVILAVTRNPYAFRRKQTNIVFKGFFNAYFRRKRSAVMTLVVPSEIFAALGIAPMMIESMGGVLGSLGMTNRFLHAVSRAGLPESLCTFHRMYLSFALEGGMPAPRFTVAASALCDGNLRAMQHFSELTGSDFYFLDFPHEHHEEGVAYLAGQLERSYFEMARAMNVRNPEDRLKKAVENSEKARELLVAIGELRKTRYLPGLNDLIWLIAVISAFTGTRQAVDLFHVLHDDLKYRGAEIPANTKRLLLIHLLPVYEHPVFEKMFARNVIIAVEEYTHIVWPRLAPDRPFESIARRALSWPMMDSIEDRIARLNRMIDDYSIDGVIYSGHWGCRQEDGPIHAVRSRVSVPFLRVETDLVDENQASVGQLNTRLEGFLEMIGT